MGAAHRGVADSGPPAAAPDGLAGTVAVAAPSIRKVHGKVSMDLTHADRRRSIEQLAQATGSRLVGLERLPPSLGSVSLKALDVDTAAAWHLLLDTAPLGFALACPGASCEVWFAVASVAQRVPPPAPADAALLPARASPVRRVQSTEDDN